MLNHSDQHILPNGEMRAGNESFLSDARNHSNNVRLSSSMVLGTGPQIHYFFHIDNFKNNVQQG